MVIQGAKNLEQKTKDAKPLRKVGDSFAKYGSKANGQITFTGMYGPIQEETEQFYTEVVTACVFWNAK